jgi:hypothetical protein
VRAAIIAALGADPDVTALVGGRIRGRVALLGGLQPGDFDADGVLVGPSLVVVLESRTREGQAPDTVEQRVVAARQAFALYGYAPEADGFEAIRAVHRAARRVLHRARLAPLEEVGVRWRDTRWQSLAPEQVDSAYTPGIPVMVARYDAVIADPLDD